MAQMKIFGIGAHRTDTSSLTIALRMLGYRASHWDDHSAIRCDIEQGRYRLALMESMDAVSDFPIPTVWRALVDAFPEAKFILTLRSTDSWVASVELHTRNRTLYPEEQDFYGCCNFDRDTFLARYSAHNREVIEHFAGQENFLIMDIPGGDGWRQLCPFLGVPVPDPLPDFPWVMRSFA